MCRPCAVADVGATVTGDDWWGLCLINAGCCLMPLGSFWGAVRQRLDYRKALVERFDIAEDRATFAKVMCCGLCFLLQELRELRVRGVVMRGARRGVAAVAPDVGGSPKDS